MTATDEASLAGVFPLDGKGKIKFTLSKPLQIPPLSSLDLEYRIEGTGGTSVEFIADGEESWSLPQDLSFLKIRIEQGMTIRYRIPIRGASLSEFRIASKPTEDKASSTDKSSPVFTLSAVRVAPRAFGYTVAPDVVFASPFVSIDPASPHRVTVDLRADSGFDGPFFVRLMLPSSRGKLSVGAESFTYVGAPKPETPFSVRLPAGAVPVVGASGGVDGFSIVYESAALPASFIVGAESAPKFPTEPIVADPGIILAYRQDAWRDSRYEVFRWERFPSILIFDTADYAVQERLFKRLAFFVEKAGFRGKLAAESEIAGLHGWNAHDYRASDLTAFFETARSTHFKLNDEERELLEILVSTGIVTRGASGKIEEGTGAIVSISRESESYLRNLFMTHECLHGIFFIDEDFRRFSEERWQSLSRDDARFLKMYFDSRRYDINDSYLMMNELMAYTLQQPVALASRYFGELLPSRMEKDSWRASVLPPRTPGEIGWPGYAESFTKLAGEFDGYIHARWGLHAGSVATVYQISRTNAAR